MYRTAGGSCDRSMVTTGSYRLDDIMNNQDLMEGNSVIFTVLVPTSEVVPFPPVPPLPPLPPVLPLPARAWII